MKKNRKLAFTLAEVLITVGIIGVVAALTVPNLMSNYQKEAQAVQFRKFTVEFANAVDLTITEEGKTTLAGTYVIKKNDGIDSFMKNKFNIAKESAGFADSYRSIDATSSKSFSCSGKEYLLKNSSAVCVIKDGSYLDVYVDINGEEAPNIGGRDMFIFRVSPTGNIGPASPQSGDISSSCQKCMDDNPDNIGAACDAAGGACSTKSGSTMCGKTPFGTGCYDKLVENNWKMDY